MDRRERERTIREYADRLTATDEDLVRRRAAQIRGERELRKDRRELGRQQEDMRRLQVLAEIQQKEEETARKEQPCQLLPEHITHL